MPNEDKKEAQTKLDEFYDNLQTLPGLIAKLGESVAEAQRKFDENYVRQLTSYLQAIAAVGRTQGIKADDYLSLLRDLAPSRMQFSETVAEVRADLQMTSMKEFSIGGEVGIKASIFAVTVNAAYTQRSAYDARAAATIRTVLHAVPASEAVLDKILTRVGQIQGPALPKADRYQSMADAFITLMNLLPAPAGSPPQSPPSS